MEPINVILVSLLSSTALFGILTFVVKRYFDKYFAYYFDRRVNSEKVHDELIAEIKKKFFATSIEVYAKIFRLAFRCHLLGRESAQELIQQTKIPNDEILKKLSEAFTALQSYLENQVFLDVGDYQKIHAYKNNFHVFCLLYQERILGNELRSNQANVESYEPIVRYWRDVVEPSFAEYQNVARVYSLRNDA
jgi:hypothetical protein